MSQHPNSLAALAAHRAKTQYGAVNGNPRSQDIPGGNKPWSARMTLRHLAAQRIDPDDPSAVKNLIPAKPTMAQLMAVNTFTKAIKAEDMRAVEYITNQIDGKLQNPNAGADFAAILELSDDELFELCLQLEQDILAHLASESDGGADRNKEPAGSPVIIENENERGGPSGNTDGI